MRHLNLIKIRLSKPYRFQKWIPQTRKNVCLQKATLHWLFHFLIHLYVSAGNKGILTAIVTAASADLQTWRTLQQKVGRFFLSVLREVFGCFRVILHMCLHQQQNCKSFHRFWNLHASLLQVCFDSNMFGHSSSSSASFSNHSWQKNDRFLGIFPEHIDQVDYFLSPKLLYLSIKHCLGIKLAKNDRSLMTMTDTKS